jgi:hypothetical protein
MQPTTVGADSAEAACDLGATRIYPSEQIRRHTRCELQQTGRLSRSGPVNRAVSFRYPGDVVIPARRGILAFDRDLDHLGSHALVPSGPRSA